MCYYSNYIALLWLVISLIFPFEVLSKEPASSSNTFLRYASRAVEMGDYYTALEMLEKYSEFNPDNEKINKQIAEYYYLTRQYYKANETYSELLRKSPNDEDVLFFYAKTKKALGKYEAAIDFFEKCRRNTKDDYLLVRCRKEIVGCKKALDAIEEPFDVDIINQRELNSNHVESSPMFLSDSVIIYSSLNQEASVSYSIYDSSELKFMNLYKAVIQDSIWKPAGEFFLFSDKVSYDVANTSISVDGKRLYFTLCKTNWLHKKICSLYVANYDNERDVKSLGDLINSENFSSTHPAISGTYDENLEVIYFSSDRPGGLGGMDIWYTIYNKKKGSYSKPNNLGGKINSGYNEITPFYNELTRTLYYSTDRAEGFGGYDIYKSTGNMRSWYVASNIGYPFNTNSDEMYYSVNKNQIDGFLVSNRLGSKTLADNFCCYDIYSLKIKNKGRIIIKGSYMASIEPSIKKLLNNGLELTSDIIIDKREMNVALYMYFNESTDSMFIVNDTLNNEGDYELLAESGNDYKLFFYNEDRIENVQSVSTKNIDPSENREIDLEKTEISILPKQALVINNIIYEFGSSELTEKAKRAIDSSIVIVLKENPKIKVEISSHTDSVGDKSYNMTLSEKRASSVVEYLSSKEINESRLVAKGYGEDKPLYPNTNPDGSDNIEGREKNRRTEFKIIDEVSETKIDVRRTVF